MAASDARPVPRKNTAFRLYFAIRKSDGTLITSWTGADSEVSIDGAAFSDCTNEATEIGTTGCGYIDFTSSEMNGDAIVYKLTVTNTSALPVVVTLFPEEVGDYRVNVEQFGGNNGTFSGGRPEVNATHLAGTAYASADFSTTMKASINTEADTALTDYGALKPTTAGRTLDVSAGGEAGLDWTNIGGATTTVNLSGTTVKTATDVEADTADIQTRLPAALVSGRIDASVGAMASNTLTAAALATDALTEIQSGLATSSALTTVEGKVDTIDTVVDAILADTGTDGVVVASGSKTGYKLASDGLDTISTTTPSGVASNFREMLVQVWRRFFKKSTLTSTQLKTYADDGTTVVTTQTVSDDGTTQTQGAAS